MIYMCVYICTLASLIELVFKELSCYGDMSWIDIFALVSLTWLLAQGFILVYQDEARIRLREARASFRQYLVALPTLDINMRWRYACFLVGV